MTSASADVDEVARAGVIDRGYLPFSPYRPTHSVQAMTGHFVECYWPGVDEPLLTRAVERLASGPGRRADAVCWLSSILIPDDEIVLHVAEGSAADAVRASALQAGVPTERIVSCVHVASPTSQAQIAVAVESREINQPRGGSSA